MTLRDLSEKDVIQVVLHGRARMFGLLGRDDDLFIPWAAVKTIGTDVIMVDAEVPPPHANHIRKGWM